MAFTTPSLTVLWNQVKSAGPAKTSVKKVVEGAYNDDPVFAFLKKYCLVDHDGAAIVTWPIRHSKRLGDYIQGGTPYSTTKPNDVTTAQLDIATLNAQVYWDWTEKLRNRGPEKIFNLIDERMEELGKAMNRTRSAALYGTATADVFGTTQLDTSLVGLQTAVPDTATSGTYANITRDSTASTDFFKNYTSNIGGAITKAALSTAIRACSVGGYSPNLVVCGEEVFGYLHSLAATGNWLRQNAEATDLGFPDNIELNGAAIVHTKFLTATSANGELTTASGRIYILTVKKACMELRVDPQDNMTVHEPIRVAGQLTWEQSCTHTEQLCIKAPRNMGVLYGVTS